MTTTAKTYMNWSGGKDSSISLYKLLRNKNYSVNTLLTNVNAKHDRISMHGVRRSLLIRQSESMGIPLQTIELPEQPGMQEYEQAMADKVEQLKKEGYTTAAFGDIYLRDLKEYREQQLAKATIDCVFPIWEIPVAQLMEEFIALGFKAIVVCVNEQYLDKSFCGRIIDKTFVKDLPAHVDICGENGEYHSFVFDGPLFQYPVPYTKGDIVHRTYEAPKVDCNTSSRTDLPSSYGFYFCDLL